MTFKTRPQIILGKLAGYDVSLLTMTPGVAASPEEKLALEIADRIDTIEGKAVGAPANATADKAGVVKQAANVPAAAGESPTKAEFDALLEALRTAGIMAAPSQD